LPVDPLIQRYRLPQVILPVDNDDIANKVYVDTQIAARSHSFYLGCGRQPGATDTTDLFYDLQTGPSGAMTITEASCQMTAQKALTVLRVLAMINVNSRTLDLPIGIRDDGVTVASATISSATTGLFDSGAIAVAIAAGSLVNWIIGFSAGTGTLTIESMYVELAFA